MPTHSNLFVKNFPPTVDQGELLSFFEQYGIVEAYRFVEQATHNYAFIKMSSIEEAVSAQQNLHGALFRHKQLSVKFAESDLKPEEPRDNLYVRHIPPQWQETDLHREFSAFGQVTSTRVLEASVGEDQAGLVRMASPAEAAAAKQGLNGRMFDGTSFPLSITFAQSNEDRERRGRTSARAPTLTPAPRYAPYSVSGASIAAAPQTSYGAPLPGPPIYELSNAPAMDYDAGYAHVYNDPGFVPAPALHAAPRTPSGVYIRNLPREADKLFLFENFAIFGGVSGATVLHDSEGKCNGVGFVNYTSREAALDAIRSMHGVRVGTNTLHVELQKPKSGPRR